MTDLGDQRMPFMMNGTFNRFNEFCPSEHGMKTSHTKFSLSIFHPCLHYPHHYPIPTQIINTCIQKLLTCVSNGLDFERWWGERRWAGEERNDLGLHDLNIRKENETLLVTTVHHLFYGEENMRNVNH